MKKRHEFYQMRTGIGYISKNFVKVGRFKIFKNNTEPPT